MVLNFIVTDFTNDSADMLFYDEWVQGCECRCVVQLVVYIPLQ
jgi:hypothetical protein